MFIQEHADGKTVTLIRDEYVDLQVLAAEIRPKQVRYFSRKLGIPIHFFWNPEVADQAALDRLKEVDQPSLGTDSEEVPIRLKKPSDQ